MKNSKRKILLAIIIILACILVVMLHKAPESEQKADEGEKEPETIRLELNAEKVTLDNAEELLDEAQLIVRCSIDYVKETTFVNGTDIWTYCYLDIKEIYKGWVDDAIVYRFQGGEYGKYVQESPYALEEDKEYILFLKKSHYFHYNAIGENMVIDITGGDINNNVFECITDKKTDTVEAVEDMITEYVNMPKLVYGTYYCGDTGKYVRLNEDGTYFYSIASGINTAPRGEYIIEDNYLIFETHYGAKFKFEILNKQLKLVEENYFGEPLKIGMVYVWNDEW